MTKRGGELVFYVYLYSLALIMNSLVVHSSPHFTSMPNFLYLIGHPNPLCLSKEETVY